MDGHNVVENLDQLSANMPGPSEPSQLTAEAASGFAADTGAKDEGEGEPKQAADETLRSQLVEEAVALLAKTEKGLRHKELRQEIHDITGANLNTITGAIGDLLNRTKDVYKPARGLYKHVSFKVEDSLVTDTQQDELDPGTTAATPETLPEEKLYGPFATYLKDEIEVCTSAIDLGGKVFGEKWQTPDVIGIFESKRSHLIAAPIEVICAEIKTTKSKEEILKGFGQACAYKLFSHRVYLVLPSDLKEEDVSRYDSMCEINGIGLVLFSMTTVNDEETFSWSLRVRPRRGEPDYFYMNDYLQKIENRLF